MDVKSRPSDHHDRQSQPKTNAHINSRKSAQQIYPIDDPQNYKPLPDPDDWGHGRLSNPPEPPQAPGRRSLLKNSENNTRDSYGRARSQPHNKQPSIDPTIKIEHLSPFKLGPKESPQKRPSVEEKLRIESESGTAVEVTLTQKPHHQSVQEISILRRRSVDDNDYDMQLNRRRRTKDSLNEVEVTRHMLFKEALYTAIHMLGRATKRFPSSKEEISIYVVQTFCDSKKEESAVLEHIKGDSFPVTIVNTKIRRGENIQSLGNERPPNPYCVVATQEDETTVVFHQGKKDWAQHVAQGDGPLQRIKKFITQPTGSKRKNSHPLPEYRKSQLYEKIIAYKTSLQQQTNSPLWEQKFQVLVSRPSTDILTVEVWDHPIGDHLFEAIQTYKENSYEDQEPPSIARLNHFNPRKSHPSHGRPNKTRYSHRSNPNLGLSSHQNSHHSTPTLKDKIVRRESKVSQGQGNGKGDGNGTGNRKGPVFVQFGSENEDNFLGKVSIKVSDILCEGVENWFYLEGKTKGRDREAHGKLRLAVWLVYAFRHGRHYIELVEPKVYLECMWDWILGVEKARNGPDWDGSLAQPATCLLFQYALQNGISEDTHAIIRWNAYAKHKLNLQEIGTALNDLDGALERKTSIKRTSLNILIEPERDESQEQIEESFLLIMKTKILPIIRNHLAEPEESVTEACKSYKKLRDILSNFDFSPARYRITWLFENSIRLCILEWYEKMFTETVHIIPGIREHEFVSFYVQVMNQVLQIVRAGFAKWGKVFYLNCETEYMSVMYDELQKMVNHDIESLCWNILDYYHDNIKLRKILLIEEKDEEVLCRTFASLYFLTQVFVEMKEEIFANIENKPDYFNLTQYHRWFRPILVLWLGFAVVRGSELVSKCINIDNASLDNIKTKTSTSALDTANVFHQLVDFWMKLRWPDVAENYVIIHFLIEVMCYYTVLFAKRKHEKLQLEGYFDTEDRFDISQRLCTALNNIEYVKEYLESIPIQINQEQLLSKLEEECGATKETEAYRNRLNYILTLTFANVETIFVTILTGLADRVKPELTQFVQECLEILRNSGEIDTEQVLHDASDPILSYLESNIVTLQESLLELNFARILQLFWNLMNQEIKRLAPIFRIKSTDEQVIFFSRILMIYPIFEDYFKGGDAGLTQEELNTEDFRQTYTLMKYYTMESFRLIDMHYGTRGEQQINNGIITYNNKAHPKFGYITIRIGYWDKKLSAEILCCTNIHPTDNSFNFFDLCKKKTPKSDPFVEVELRPLENFVNRRTSKTEVRWKTLNPIYNEKFQWDVTMDECLKDNSVIVFTVKDYDFLSKNDFLGEAMIPLSMIPGISNNPLPQPMQLHLKTVDSSSFLIQVLQSRPWDIEAIGFMTIQTPRFSLALNIDDIE